MSTSTAWATKVQGATKAQAEAWGERWTKEDVEFVVEFTNDETDEDLALALGRTLFALWAIQHRIRNEGVVGVIASLEGPATPLVRPLSERVYTFIGDDTPEGW